MGIVPIWGYQMLVAVTLAHFFRLNKAIVLVSSNISIPPMIPFILYASAKTGAWLLGEHLSLSFHHMTLEAVKTILTQYILGSFAFAALVGMLGWLSTFAVLKQVRKSF